MNSKGQLATIMIIVGVILFVVLIIVIFVSINQKASKPIDTSATNSITSYIIIKDGETHALIDGNYTILNHTNYLFGQVLKESYAEVDNLSNNQSEIMQILCQAPGYYSELLAEPFTNQEILQNVSKEECFLKKIGTIKINSDSYLVDGSSLVTLTVLAKGYYQNLTVCTSWTGGVINVNLKYADETEKPDRYKDTTDKCFAVNQNLKDNSLDLDFEVKANGTNTNDKIVIALFDNDFVFNNGFVQLSEMNNINLGFPIDTIYEVKKE